MGFTAKCGKCNSIFDVEDDSWLGMEAECPECQTVITLAKDEPKNKLSIRKPRAMQSNPAGSQTVCPFCHKPLADGETVICIECGTNLKTGQKLVPNQSQNNSTSTLQPGPIIKLIAGGLLFVGLLFVAYKYFSNSPRKMTREGIYEVTGEIKKTPNGMIVNGIMIYKNIFEGLKAKLNEQGAQLYRDSEILGVYNSTIKNANSVKIHYHNYQDSNKHNKYIELTGDEYQEFVNKAKVVKLLKPLYVDVHGFDCTCEKRKKVREVFKGWVFDINKDGTRIVKFITADGKQIFIWPKNIQYAIISKDSNGVERGIESFETISADLNSEFLEYFTALLSKHNIQFKDYKYEWN